jgi:hypothetical protein
MKAKGEYLGGGRDSGEGEPVEMKKGNKKG